MFCNQYSKITGRYSPFFLSHKNLLIGLKSDFNYPLTIAFYRETEKNNIKQKKITFTVQ